MSDSAPALDIQQLRKTYDGQRVVKDISFNIPQGEIFGLLGPNGAGKSTTINLVGGVARHETGQVRIFGYDNQKDFAITRRLTGVMHQEVVIDSFFKIGTGLKIHSGYYGKKDDPKWRELLIEKLALGEYLDKPMMKLSGGTKRRYMVAKAMIHRPKLLILDEPTAGVDIELRRTLWEFVREINRQGTTVLLTTHYLEEAEQMCERIAIMDHGEVVALDSKKNLMEKIQNRTLEIRMGRPLEIAPEVFREFDPQLNDNGKTMKLTLLRKTKTGEVIERLREANIQIDDLLTHTPHLEDVFLKLTKKGSK